MRKVIVIEFISLDGVIQAPGRADEDTSNGFEYGGWISHFSDSFSSEAIRKEMNMPFDLLLGRKTFDIWASFWPQHNDVWPGVNAATKYVASTTMTYKDWQPSVFLRGDIEGEVRKLKAENGPNLHVYGSSILLQTLIRHDLVDEYRLKIHPITIGKGKRLFAEGTIPAAFTITGSVVTSTGVILVNYRRAGDMVSGEI